MKLERWQWKGVCLAFLSRNVRDVRLDRDIYLNVNFSKLFPLTAVWNSISLNSIYFQISIHTSQHTSTRMENGLENKLLKTYINSSPNSIRRKAMPLVALIYCLQSVLREHLAANNDHDTSSSVEAYLFTVSNWIVLYSNRDVKRFFCKI